MTKTELAKRTKQLKTLQTLFPGTTAHAVTTELNDYGGSFKLYYTVAIHHSSFDGDCKIGNGLTFEQAVADLNLPKQEAPDGCASHA